MVCMTSDVRSTVVTSPSHNAWLPARCPPVEAQTPRNGFQTCATISTWSANGDWEDSWKDMHSVFLRWTT
ncbi:hypothetical protein CHARACLAT_021805 [Characodon lateralis]|uniref:Uncharacterized protein n=1 Tax=Characodon lateralis TaxID=208331 RepID=A0ABU7EMX3_9TELE|nr:hypothetical protein [Characodon lateralis]